MKLTRIAFSALTAGLLVLGSGAAALAAPTDNGYRAPGITVVITDLSPTAGQTFFVIIHGHAGEHITLTITSPTAPSTSITIAGTQALTKTADASGTAQFAVTLADPGTYTLVATDADTGAVLATQVVTVAAGTAVGTEGTLASTGSNDALPITVGAAALVVAGAGGVLIARRRRASASVDDDE